MIRSIWTLGSAALVARRLKTPLASVAGLFGSVVLHCSGSSEDVSGFFTSRDDAGSKETSLSVLPVPLIRLLVMTIRHTG